MATKITIIGGAGFVGTNLCSSFARKRQDFEIIDLKISKLFPEKSKIADIRNLDTLRNAITGDMVIHLAAVHRDDNYNFNQYRKTNVDGTENVATVCKEKGIKKIVFTSTVAVYGFAKPGTDETGEINPFNEYGRTKFQAEKKLIAWQSDGDNSLIIVRPTVIFGPGNRGNVFNLLNQIASGKFIMVGKGENRKSMAFIDNVVSFLETCVLCEQKFAVYNYIDTPNLTMNELVSHVRAKLKGKNGVGFRLPYWLGISVSKVADLFSKVIKKPLPISSIRVKKFTSDTEFAMSSASQFHFIRPFSLNEGLDKTLESEFINPDPKREIFHTE